MNLFHKKSHSVTKAKSSFWKYIGKNAYIDWSIILIIAGAVAIVLVFFGVSMYLNYETETEVEPIATADVIEKDKLKKALDTLKNRELLRSEIGSMPQFRDPAI